MVSRTSVLTPKHPTFQSRYCLHQSRFIIFILEIVVTLIDDVFRVVSSGVSNRITVDVEQRIGYILVLGANRVIFRT